MSRQIAEKAWNGSVHVHVSYKGIEYMLDVKRVSYFPVYFPRLVAFFGISTSSSSISKSAVLLEYEDVPLKWNLPIGLLYDLLFLPSQDKGSTAPWRLELKADSPGSPYPVNDILPFTSAKDGAIEYGKCLDHVFINALKQSCFVLNGNSRSVMSLSADDTFKLWHAMATHDMTVFSHIRSKLACPGKDSRHRIPLKIYLAGSAALYQAPVWSKDLDGTPNTLSRVLCDQVTGLAPQTIPEIYIHGINVDVLLNEPVRELWARFRFMDNYLYIVLVAKD